MPNNLFELYPRTRTGTSSPVSLPQSPAASGRSFATGIPGFDELSGIASGNVKNLLEGEEDPGIVRNMNAEWGAGSGLAPGSEFLRNRAVDLYGERGAARKSQGMKDLLSMLQGYSGTVVASPGQILGDEGSRRQEALEQQRFGESQRQFNEQLAYKKQIEAERLALENKRFGLQQRGYNDSRPKAPVMPTTYYQRYGAGIGGGALDSQHYTY